MTYNVFGGTLNLAHSIHRNEMGGLMHVYFSVHDGKRSGTMPGVVLPLVFQLADRTV